MTATSIRRRAEKRREAARRLEKRVVVPVGEELASRDPLLGRGRRGEGRRVTSFVVAGVAAQAIIAAVLTLLGTAADGHAMSPREERVVVRVVEPPPIEEPRVAPPPEPEVVATGTPERLEPTPKIVRRQNLRSDPVDAPAEPRAQSPRRVVGLSLESTVEGGKGPAFATGDTRMGTTGAVAEKPTALGSPGGSDASAGGNARADFVPTSASTLVKPKRLAEPKLDYPQALKAQGVEGDVTVLIRIGADGAVGDVRIVKGSGVKELDAAARAAAARERFAPATRDGEPVEYTLKYTYRFRIVDA